VRLPPQKSFVGFCILVFRSETALLPSYFRLSERPSLCNRDTETGLLRLQFLQFLLRSLRSRHLLVLFQLHIPHFINQVGLLRLAFGKANRARCEAAPHLSKTQPIHAERD